jgi:hypothetical protein
LHSETTATHRIGIGRSSTSPVRQVTIITQLASSI